MRVFLVADNYYAMVKNVELLEAAMFDVYGAVRYEGGVGMAKRSGCDIILLDLNLSDMSNYEVIRTLRITKVETPIMVLSSATDVEAKVRALDLGADDYLAKPFHKDELIARIRSIVRRVKGHVLPIIKVGDITVNLNTKVAAVKGKHLHLSNKEYQTLEILAIKKGEPVSKDMFLDYLYDDTNEPEAQTLNMFIFRLRKKLADANCRTYIDSVYGHGYVLRDPDESEAAA